MVAMIEKVHERTNITFEWERSYYYSLINPLEKAEKVKYHEIMNDLSLIYHSICSRYNHNNNNMKNYICNNQDLKSEWPRQSPVRGVLYFHL